MRVAIPHQLGKAEARRRLQSRGHEIGSFMPGGIADVAVTWPSQDRMAMNVGAMGQQVAATVDIEEHQVWVDVQLPPALSFFGPVIQGAIEQQGRKLLK
ncbi:MAG: polyhydroxyalkanoic acid system family protein [Novosphingobium sp.]|nr:polyhydroxyalkanoic acid system family protein [Novosphingobium sp.]